MSDEAAGAAGVKKTRTGLKHPLVHYAQAYDTSPRTIKRWKGQGAPLDDPEGMLAWWPSVSPQKAPAGIYQAVIEARKGAAFEAGDERERARVPVPEGELDLSEPIARAQASEKLPDGPRPPLVVPEGRGLEAELERLENLAARLSVTASEPGQAAAYIAAVGKMIIMQQKLREEWEKSGRLVPKELVEAALVDLHSSIAGAVRAMFKEMCIAMGVPAMPAGEEKWNEACDALFARFQGEVLA